MGVNTDLKKLDSDLRQQIQLIAKTVNDIILDMRMLNNKIEDLRSKVEQSAGESSGLIIND